MSQSCGEAPVREDGGMEKGLNALLLELPAARVPPLYRPTKHLQEEGKKSNRGGQPWGCDSASSRGKGH